MSDCLHDFEMEPKLLADSCGDHRGMVIQLKMGPLFNLREHDIMGPRFRKPKSNDAKGVVKYIDKLLDGVENT